MQINYSIIKYHQKHNLLQDNNEKPYYDFIMNNNIINNYTLSIKKFIPKDNEKLEYNNILIRKLIYENLL